MPPQTIVVPPQPIAVPTQAIAVAPHGIGVRLWTVGVPPFKITVPHQLTSQGELMPRLTEQDRVAVVNDFNGHYEELLQQHPGWEFEPGFGLPALRALEQGYFGMVQEIATIEETTLTNQRAQRDGLFGASGDDVDGVWFALTLYKKLTRSRLPKTSTLLKTVPLIGNVSPGNYDAHTHQLKQF